MDHRPLIVCGDTLLDRDLDGHVDRLCADAPAPVVDDCTTSVRPGGAGLAALMAARSGADVVLVTALGDDDAGRTVARLLVREGVRVIDAGPIPATPEKVRIRAGGRTLLRLDRTRPQASPQLKLPPAVERVISTAGAVLVADYGYGLASADLRAVLARRVRRIPVVWDPHPQGSAPVAGAALVTPNRSETARLVPEVAGEGLAAWSERARRLQRRWNAAAVAVTLGADGALVMVKGAAPAIVAAPAVHEADPCGAGDRFAVAAAIALADGAAVVDAVSIGVSEASAFVADGGAASADGSRPTGTVSGRRAEDVVAGVRRRGGTVVVTGGCFDLLHAGHVAMLEAARRLGDCLVVLLNSDESVRRLKGPDRPINDEADRAAVLAGLSCVDAVQVFAEDTPVEALERLRPDVFVKGGDYAGDEIPEAAAMRSWGGQFVTVPYVAGRSTTRMIEEVLARAS